MSNDFEKLKKKWDLHYITEETLRKYVALNQKNANVGITAAEFTQITGIAF